VTLLLLLLLLRALAEVCEPTWRPSHLVAI
jgi:hypothetical protein